MIYTHVAAALLGAAIAGYGGWTARGWKSDADAAAVRESAEEVRRLREKAAHRGNERIDRENSERTARAMGMDAADRDELERLRIAAARRDAQPAAAACGPVEQSFRECRAALEEGAGLVVEGARIVRELGRAHEGLRGYAAEVGGVQLNAP